MAITLQNAATEFPYYTDAVNDANKFGIPQNIFLSLINTESGFNPNAKSDAGAIGFTQLLPGTASDLGINPNNPQENLYGGAEYLAKQYQTFGNWTQALEAYNEGPNALKSGTVPNSVSQYADTILTNAGDAAQSENMIGGISTNSITDFLKKFSPLYLFQPGSSENAKAKTTTWFQEFFGESLGDTGLIVFGAILVLAAMIFMSKKETINIVAKAAKAAVI